MAKSFWLGISGGIAGILGGVIMLVLSNLLDAFGGSSSIPFTLGLIAIVSSIIGMAAGALNDRKMSSGFMIFSAISVLIAISFYGILASVLFLIGGLIKYTQND